LSNVAIAKIIQERKKQLVVACGITREEIVRGTLEVIQRCRMKPRQQEPPPERERGRSEGASGRFQAVKRPLCCPFAGQKGVCDAGVSKGRLLGGSKS
jgi:hypothetical protein